MKAFKAIINFRVDIHELDEEGKCLPGKNIETGVFSFFDVDEEHATQKAIEFFHKIEELYNETTSSPQTNKT